MRPAGKVASLAGSGGRRVSARPAPHDVVAASGWPRETRPPLCRMPTSSGGGATASRQPRQKTGNARPKGRLSNGGDVRPGEKGAPAVASRVQRRPYPQEKGALLTAVSAPPHPIVVGPVASAHLRDSPRACAEGGACVVQWYLGDPAGASCLWVFLAGPCTGLGGHLDPDPDPRSRPVALTPSADKSPSPISHVASQGNRTQARNRIGPGRVPKQAGPGSSGRRGNEVTLPLRLLGVLASRQLRPFVGFLFERAIVVSGRIALLPSCTDWEAAA